MDFVVDVLIYVNLMICLLIIVVAVAAGVVEVTAGVVSSVMRRRGSCQ